MERADISFHSPGTAISGTAWPSAVQSFYPLLCFISMLLRARESVQKMAPIFSLYEFLSLLKTDQLQKSTTNKGIYEISRQ